MNLKKNKIHKIRILDLFTSSWIGNMTAVSWSQELNLGLPENQIRKCGGAGGIRPGFREESQHVYHSTYQQGGDLEFSWNLHVDLL